MIIYYYKDNDWDGMAGNQVMYFFTGKTIAEKERRRHARGTYNTREEQIFWLNENPLMSFELKGKDMIVHCLNQAAMDGFVSCIEHAEEI